MFPTNLFENTELGFANLIDKVPIIIQDSFYFFLSFANVQASSRR